MAEVVSRPSFCFSDPSGGVVSRKVNESHGIPWGLDGS